MSTEDLRKAVTEAIEAGLFVPSSTDPEEPETDLTEDETLSPYPCSSCKHFDEDLLNCSFEHCPYIQCSEDDLEGQQYLY